MKQRRGCFERTWREEEQRVLIMVPDNNNTTTINSSIDTNKVNDNSSTGTSGANNKGGPTPLVQRQGKISISVEAMSLLCYSGFVRLEEVQVVSVLYCNVCREASIPRRLTLGEGTPTRLLRLIQQSSAVFAAAAAAVAPPSSRRSAGTSQRVRTPLSIQHIR